MCDSTNMAIVFYTPRLKVRKFHPSCFPVELLPRIADIPNVVAMKISTLGMGECDWSAQCFHLIGDKILVNHPLPDAWFITVPKFGQQWAGAGPFSIYQTPENPRIVKMWHHLQKGEMDKAFELHWQILPLHEISGALLAQVNYLQTGIVNGWAGKYLHWCNGGNGGSMRMPIGRLFDYQKETLRAALREIGLTPSENEEEFYVGRMNYAKGARLKKY